ncbi:unnamed protein product [Caenorhabditis angaria]|uniref:G-protein coupled receptors family 1 profile domain-containing protein n=1 Tax=Caenorhabditis angaria TaxID=860376 RepID=A0A9P1IR98_9PELO|nr:unnamed protein product [Caenorhabditis angaria]
MNQERDDYMRSTILETYDLEIETTSYICVLFHPFDEDGQSYPDYQVFIAIGVCWIEILTSMWAVFYFGIKCYCLIRKALRKSDQTSRKTKGLQQQLFQALVVQTCIPLILMYIPIAILFIFPMLHIDIGFTSSFVAITIAIYPAIDPLPNMFIINSYRKTISRLFKMCLTCSLDNTTANRCSIIEPRPIEMKIMKKLPKNNNYNIVLI